MINGRVGGACIKGTRLFGYVLSTSKRTQKIMTLYKVFIHSSIPSLPSNTSIFNIMKIQLFSYHISLADAKIVIKRVANKSLEYNKS